MHHWNAHRLSTAGSVTASTSSTINSNDPPPLEDQLAKRLSATLNHYLTQPSAHEDAHLHNQPPPLSLRSKPSGIFLSRRPSMGSISTISRDDIPIPPSITGKSSQLRSTSGVVSVLDEPQPMAAVSEELLQSASKILFYVSASNWSLVFGTLKSRIPYWSGSDDNPDTSGIRRLEYWSLDRRRLTDVIKGIGPFGISEHALNPHSFPSPSTELSTSFVHLKRNVQAAMAGALRLGIWTWIETLPDQYSALVADNRRIDGADTLFDICYGLAESNKKKSFIWPLMAMLLVCCPDVVAKLVVGEIGRNQGLTKKVSVAFSLWQRVCAFRAPCSCTDVLP